MSFHVSPRSNRISAEPSFSACWSDADGDAINENQQNKKVVWILDGWLVGGGGGKGGVGGATPEVCEGTDEGDGSEPCPDPPALNITLPLLFLPLVPFSSPPVSPGRVSSGPAPKRWARIARALGKYIFMGCVYLPAPRESGNSVFPR